MPRRNRRKKKNKPPPKPSYASLIKKSTPVQSAENVTDDAEDAIPTTISIPSFQKQPKLNTVPFRRNHSRDTWEHAYFRQLLDLRKIFISHIHAISPHTNTDLFRTADFMDNFAQFLYEESSGYISPYIGQLSEHTENCYDKYLIKRNVDQV